MDRLNAANRPGWTQYAAGDAVAVLLDDIWEPGEIKELQHAGAAYSYRIWLIDKKTRHVLVVSEADEFDGSLRRRNLAADGTD